MFQIKCGLTITIKVMRMPELYREHILRQYRERIIGLYGSGNIEFRSTPDTFQYILKENNRVILEIQKNNVHKHLIAAAFNDTVLPNAFNDQKALLEKNCPASFSAINAIIQKNLNFNEIKRAKKKETLVRCLQALNTYIKLLQPNLIRVGNDTINYVENGKRTLYYKMLCNEANKLHHQRMKPLAIALMTLGILCTVAAILIAAVNIGFILSGIFAPLTPILFGASAGLGVVGIGLFAKGAYSLAQYRQIPEDTQDALKSIKNIILHPTKT